MLRSKKTLLSMGSIGLAVVATLASGSTAWAASNNSKQENITFAWWTTPARTIMTEKAVSLFEKQNPNIHVTMEYSPWSGYWTKMATEAAGGNLPDVMQMDASYINQYVDNGTLLDMAGTSINTKGINPNTVKLGLVNGKLYGLPVAINSFLNIDNPAILKEAHISFNPNKSYTWNQFANILIEVHKKLPKVYGATDDIWQGAPLEYWATSHGQNLWSKNGKSIGMSQNTLAAWFQYWLNLQNKGGVQPAQVNASWDHTNPVVSPFNKGEVAFTYCSIGQDASYQTYLGKPIQRVLFPDWNQKSKPYILHPAMYWTISSKTKYPQAAEKLVNFLENNAQVSKIFQNDRGVPANEKNRVADAKTGGSIVAAQDTIMNKVEKISTVVPPDPSAASQITAGSNGGLLMQIGQEVTFGKLTPKQAAAQFIQQANQMLSQG